MLVLGEFDTFHERISQAQKAQKAHKKINTKTVLKAHKNI